VHFDPDTMNKVVMIIKPDFDTTLGETFYHIEVEELWAPELIRENYVITNFIHAKFYPARSFFNHIDFSVNQYNLETYKIKHKDNTATGIPINAYCDIHYKVWCVESTSISIATWGKLIFLSLDEPFRYLFSEMVSDVLSKE
jgi:hypothetical protein